MTKQGLSAANFLVLAEGHLERAQDMEASKSFPAYNSTIVFLIREAVKNVREALRLLKQQKEEPCKP